MKTTPTSSQLKLRKKSPLSARRNIHLILHRTRGPAHRRTQRISITQSPHLSWSNRPERHAQDHAQHPQPRWTCCTSASPCSASDVSPHAKTRHAQELRRSGLRTRVRMGTETAPARTSHADTPPLCSASWPRPPTNSPPPDRRCGAKHQTSKRASDARYLYTALGRWRVGSTSQTSEIPGHHLYTIGRCVQLDSRTQAMAATSSEALRNLHPVQNPFTSTCLHKE